LGKIARNRWLRVLSVGLILHPLVPAVGVVTAVAVLTAPEARAISLPNDLAANCWFQTNGRDVPITSGDWYTSTATSSTDHRHLFQIGIPAGAAFPVTVTVIDAESTVGADHDEV